ncbi:MAG TPA: hypothetical protein VD908_16250 [Cytophagales bacterium]|nr:hypothetical protein [Cytophagales bacterium]
MQNFKDKDLDDLFKKSSENAWLTFNPKAWELMEQKLKAAQAKKAFYRRIIYSGLLLLLVTGTLISINKFPLDQYEENGSLGNNNWTATKSSGENSNKGKSAVSEDKAASAGKYELEIKKNQRQHHSAQTTNAAVEEAKRKEVITFDKKISEESGITILNKQTYLPLNTSAFRTVFLTHMEKLLKEPKKEESKSKVEFIATNNPEHNSETKASDYRDVLRISALFSPDISSAFPVKNVQSGYNTGIALEYFLFRNLAVSVGILKSKKVYSSGPENYKPNDNYWKYYKKPEGIDGSCMVTDIPVNVKYFYCDKSRIRAFASVGLSSYLMRNETYTYDYATYDMTYEFSKENNHLFSVLNLSTGAEYRLGRGFSVGIEPFLKVATSGVGAGKIKLNSGGAFISLGYSLIRK